MKLKKLLAVAVAAAFALPLAAQASADSDRLILAQAGGASGSSATGTGPTGGAPSPQSAGEPKAPTAGGTASKSMDRAPEFSALDKNNDGMISRAEWDAHYRAGSAATGGATTAPSGTPVKPGGTAPSSDTATSPSTSGTGKPK